MRAKVKISVISTGQEFLLLVAKMNLKGILVFAPQIIAPNSELLLELKLGTENPIMLKGFVHKVSEDSATKKGMVIAFLNPSDSTRKSIEAFIHQTQGSSAKPAVPPKKTKPIFTPPKRNIPDVLEPEKTVIVDNTLPALSLQSPDNSEELRLSTFDEENVHHGSSDIGGETKHVQIDTLLRSKKPQKKPASFSTVYRALGIVLFLVLIVLFFRHGVEFVENKFGIKLIPEQALSLVQNPKRGTQTPQIQPVVPVITQGKLETITVEDQGDFLKISLIGEGVFSNFTSDKLKDPLRFEFSISNIAESIAPESINVDNFPLEKIETSIDNQTLSVRLFLKGKSHVEFDAKAYPHTMDIFLFRD